MSSSFILRSTVRPKHVVSTVFKRCPPYQARWAGQNRPHKKPDIERYQGQTPEDQVLIPEVQDLTPEEKQERLQESFHEVMRHVPHPAVLITAFDSPKLFTEQGTGRVYAKVPSHWSVEDLSATTNVINRLQEIDDPRELAPIARAMTVSSFTSLRMKPKPIVLFNCTIPSRTHSAIADSGMFNVYILSADEQGAKIADLFARPQHIRQQHPLGQEANTQELQQARVGPLAQLKDLGVRIVSQELWHQKWVRRFREMKTADRVDARKKWILAPPHIEGPGILYRLTCQVLDSRYDKLPSNSYNSARSGFALVMGVVTNVERASKAPQSETSLSYVDGSYRGRSEIILQHEVATDTSSHTERDPTEHVSSNRNA